MNNETFGMTLQYAICERFDLVNNISSSRISDSLKEMFINDGIIDKIFKNNTPIQFLTTSREFTGAHIKKCPHNFLLKNGETFSIRTFQGKGKMFAPKIVGQPGNATLNHFFGHLFPKEINRSNFKKFAWNNIHEILPIMVDYALVSDINCWFYYSNGSLDYTIHHRDDKPDLTYYKKDFSFSNKSISKWNESNTVKYKGFPVAELQVHKNRPGFKLRLNRQNFHKLFEVEKEINNSVLGDSAELAICNIFHLSSNEQNDRLKNNSNKKLVEVFEKHYLGNKTDLFPILPIKYAGTEKRDRGGSSKSGVDFYLEKNMTLSVKTNKNKSAKVCPPEIGQPSPKTFDHHFKNKELYDGDIDEAKFRQLVCNQEKVVHLLKEYAGFLNECDFILWSLMGKNFTAQSILIPKEKLKEVAFDPTLIMYSNDFTTKSSVTISYGEKKFTLGEFQVHSARKSLKFRFNFNNLLHM